MFKKSAKNIIGIPIIDMANYFFIVTDLKSQPELFRVMLS